MTTTVSVNVADIDARTAIRVRQVSQNESQVYSTEYITKRGDVALLVHSGAKLIIEEIAADQVPVPEGAKSRGAEKEDAARKSVIPK